MTSDSEDEGRREVGVALYDRAIVETMEVRETLFAIGDDGLIERVDALLMALGRAAANCWNDAVLLDRPRAAA